MANQNTYGGFYAPGSISGSYVASKRNEEGSYAYDKAQQDIGMQKQAALQNLNENYGNVVGNAYASYLNSQRNIGASQMGQGYKEMYNQMQQEQLLNTIEQANLNAASARQELEQNVQKQTSLVQEAYDKEVANLDRADQALKNYFNYLNSYGYFSLNDAGKDFAAERGLAFDETGALVSGNDMLYRDLYEQLLNAQPQGLMKDKALVTDESGAPLQSFVNWVQSNAGTKQEDIDWLNWFNYGGGYDDYRRALGQSVEKEPVIVAQQRAEQKAIDKEADTLKKDIQVIIKNSVGTTRPTIQQYGPDEYRISTNGKTGDKFNLMQLDTAEKLAFDKTFKVGDVAEIKYKNNHYIIYTDIDANGNKVYYTSIIKPSSTNSTRENGSHFNNTKAYPKWSRQAQALGLV